MAETMCVILDEVNGEFRHPCWRGGTQPRGEGEEYGLGMNTTPRVDGTELVEMADEDDGMAIASTGGGPPSSFSLPLPGMDAGAHKHLLLMFPLYIHRYAILPAMSI